MSAEETLAMIARCARHQHPELFGPGPEIPAPTDAPGQGWETAQNATPAEPELPPAERGVVEGYVPLEFVSGL